MQVCSTKMSEPADFEVKRAETATTQLIIKTVLSVIMSIALIGYAMTAPNPMLGLAAWVGSGISLTILGLRVMTLLNSSVPLRITKDEVTIASSAKVRVPRTQITGAGLHPKTNEPCLYFDDPDKGHSGPLRLPMRFIGTEHPVLLGQLIDVVGRVPEEAA